MERREAFIYNFLKEKFDIKQQLKPNEQKKHHKTRQQKILGCKEELKKLKKAISDDRPDTEIRKMKQDFFKVIRLHNKITKIGAETQTKERPNPCSGGVQE